MVISLHGESYRPRLGIFCHRSRASFIKNSDIKQTKGVKQSNAVTPFFRMKPIHLRRSAHSSILGDDAGHRLYYMGYVES